MLKKFNKTVLLYTRHSKIPRHGEELVTFRGDVNLCRLRQSIAHLKQKTKVNMFRVLIRVVIILLGFSTLLNGRLYGNHELVADVLLNHMENHARLKGFR